MSTLGDLASGTSACARSSPAAARNQLVSQEVPLLARPGSAEPNAPKAGVGGLAPRVQSGDDFCINYARRSGPGVRPNRAAEPRRYAELNRVNLDDRGRARRPASAARVGRPSGASTGNPPGRLPWPAKTRAFGRHRASAATWGGGTSPDGLLGAHIKLRPRAVRSVLRGPVQGPLSPVPIGRAHEPGRRFNKPDHTRVFVCDYSRRRGVFKKRGVVDLGGVRRAPRQGEPATRTWVAGLQAGPAPCTP